MAIRIIAIDWSGAERRAEKNIWLAEVDSVDRHVVRLESGRSRAAIAEHLLDEARRTPEIVVGLDFAFSFPAWFLEQRGHADAPALWNETTAVGERWLVECSPPFWGKPDTQRPQLPEHFRRTETRVPSVGGIGPKSVFQIGGAGAVGTGSIRGMPILRQLRDGGYQVWPFDAPSTPLLLEIYPRALTGAVVKGNARDRARYLENRYPELDDVVRELAASSEDAFDALVSALVMAEHAEGFTTLPLANDDVTRREGEIWFPGEPLSAATPRRGQFNSSRTRVSPVFNALAAGGPIPPRSVVRLLDLAARGEPADRPWHHQDFTSEAQYWAPNECGLYPPVALLSWLIRNFSPPPAKLDGDGDVVQKRRKLADGDAATIEEALELLRRAGKGKAWYVLEGPTYPDTFLVTRDALIVVEGKRTEAGPTTDTLWMLGRHQMFRHLDAAWEIRGRRSVYGFFIVEANQNIPSGDVPPVWRAAAKAMSSHEVIARSLPHRGPDEQRAIADCFVGVTTWQQIIKEFGLPPAV